MEESVYENNQNKLNWKRLYNSLGLWIFIYLTTITSGFYIISVDFSLEPYLQLKPQSKNVNNPITNPTNESIKMNEQNSIWTNTMVPDDQGQQSIY